jgi:Zn-dependent protease
MFQLLANNPILFIGYIIALFTAISVHEFSHALVADRLGDPTPRLQKRVTLDPRAHLDLYGLLFLFIAGFGWGKPVQFDPYNLKNPQKDAALISIAGPISNFVLVGLSYLIWQATTLVSSDSILTTIATVLFVPMIIVNLNLGVFNLIPIHPLDGFKIVGGLLPNKQAASWNESARYGIILLLIILIPIGGHSMLNNIMDPIIQPLYHLLLPNFFN